MASSSVTTTSSTTKVTTNIRFDPEYVKSLPGILKIAEAVTSLIGFICVQTIYAAAYQSAGGWYSFVSMTGFWISLVLVVFYMFHIVEKLHWLPWLIAETGFAVAWSVCFFIAGCVAAAHGRGDPGWGAAGFFGFLAMVIYGFEAFKKYQSWKAGEIAQGERTTTTSVETTSPTGPSYPTY